MHLVSRQHAIVCRETVAALLVDFVLEQTPSAKMMVPRGSMKHAASGSRCYLACVYYAPKRGGALARYAR
jgi:hypothetical protein